MKPYPCNKGGFKSKDGIHLIFPDIILDKKAYKKIVSSIVEKDQIKNIFDEGSEIEPDNSTKGILDSSFSSWQLYGCGKTNETPYLVTRVYKIGEDDYPDDADLPEDLLKDYEEWNPYTAYMVYERAVNETLDLDDILGLEVNFY